MHYYTFHPKDYMSKTGFLEPLEDLAYRRMLDYCYLNEKPLPTDIDEIALLVSMRSHCDSIAVVLRYFFELTEDGYINDRVEKEIEAYQEKSEKARVSARARWDKRKPKKEPKTNDSNGSCERNANAFGAHDGRNANQEPLTINHEPVTRNQEPETNTNDDGEKVLNIPFDDFWKTYAKSAAKEKCENKWKSLSNKAREEIMQHLPAYVASTPVKKFRKDPHTYLNGKGWLDDIITDEPRSNQQAAASYRSMNVNAKYDDPNHDPLGGLGNRTGGLNESR